VGALVNHSDIADVLRNARGLLGQIRKAVTLGGHVDELIEFDARFSVASDMAGRSWSKSSNSGFGSKNPDQQ
jgi:hypothetical protein